MLYFVGFDVLPPFVAWSPARVSQEQRQEYLRAYAERLRAWRTTPTIPYPPLDRYDENLRLKAEPS